MLLERRALNRERLFVEIMRTIYWNPETSSVEMIDQRLLPTEFKLVSLFNHEDVADAINRMVIRGAPAIGAAAAFGLVLAAKNSTADSSEAIFEELKNAADTLRRARPTASNLNWALARVLKVAEKASDSPPGQLRELVLQEAQDLADEDVEINKRMGANGAALLPDKSTVIHHCNTGALATVDYGTALGVIRSAHESGKEIHVLVDETRPRLQGSRLTAWELDQYGIPFEIIPDSAAGFFLASGKIDAVLVGADRVAANGDVANKIGTYMLALAANDNGVPIYSVVPTSTIDLNATSGSDIPIEERDPCEVLGVEINGQPIAPLESRARNPAFDITPHRLVTAIITEVGILHPPFEISLRGAVEKARTG
jgi:methylthioribose-1-phosphate isomerase